METPLSGRRPPLHREVADRLAGRILAGDYPENTLLPPERELCAQLGVSRTVVREAVKALESRGLVRIERGRGTLVCEADCHAVADSMRLLMQRRRALLENLLEVRRVLEVAMASLAAERRTQANLAVMERTLAIMEARPGAPEGYVDADVEFHAEIARAAGNPVFLMMLEPIADLLRESRVASFSGPRMVKLRASEHRRIFEAIRYGDPNQAAAAMHDHLTGTMKDLARRARK